MVECAYCRRICDPTREHVIPGWYSRTVGTDDLETFNSRAPTKHLFGDLVVKDVCKDCNNTCLSLLDAYGNKLYIDFFREPAYWGESIEFVYDFRLLLRWLLKLCFNSGRVHNADVDILGKYANVILGHEIEKTPISLYVHLVTASDFSTAPPSPARRIIGGSEDIIAPTWFRLTQFRSDWSNLTDVVQRQVYIDSFCFTILAADPDRPEHWSEIRDLESKLVQLIPIAKSLPEHVKIQLTARDCEMSDTMEWHVANHPARYGEIVLSKHPEFAKAISALVDGECEAIAFKISRADIDQRDIRPTIDRLSELVSTRETALASMQRVAVTVDGFDDDPRELWDIQEVREWMVSVFEYCPYLFFLAMPLSKTLNLVASCYCKTERSTGCMVELDSKKVKAFLDLGFQGLNDVTQRFAISVETNKLVSESCFNVFEKMVLIPESRA